MVVASISTTLTLAVLMTPPHFGLEMAAPTSRMACPYVQAIPKVMGVGTQYAKGDASYSRIDPEAAKQERQVRAGISGPVSRISQLADRWRVADAEARPAIAQCLQSHFLAQASGEAMMGTRSVFDAYYREWMLASLAISYLKAKPGLEKLPGADNIQAWFRMSGRDVREFNEKQLQLGHIDNHRYWGAVSSMALGEAVGDPELVAFGRRVRSIGLGAVRPDGTLAAEMKRETRAFHYHMFAATALAALIMLDPKNVPSGEVDAMQRLTAAVAYHIDHPRESVFVTSTGLAQTKEDHRSMAYLLRPFAADRRNRNRLDQFVKNVPDSYQFLGGRLKFLLTYRDN